MQTQLHHNPSTYLPFQSKRKPRTDESNNSAKAKTKREAVIGEIYQTNNGKCKVVEYRDNLTVQVEFLDTGTLVWCSFGNLIQGRVKDAFFSSVFGIGYLGTSNTQESGAIKKSYLVWQSMLRRCYDPITQNNQPTYMGVKVKEVWWNYSIFEKWYEKNLAKYQNESSLELDSDLLPLAKGLIKEYGPETCLLIPTSLNMQISRLERQLFEINAYQPDNLKLPAGMHYEKKTGFICVELTKHKRRFKPDALDIALAYLKAKRIQIFKDKALALELPEDVKRVIRSLNSTSSKAH